MYDRFLVPLDGSELAERAALSAAELARLCSAHLVLLRVCLSSELVPQAVDYLEQITEQARSEELSVQGEVAVGQPASEIVKAARAEEIDLIVMSSHGRTGMARTIFGSVAETVMRNAPCPVMVVKASSPAGETEEAPRRA